MGIQVHRADRQLGVDVLPTLHAGLGRERRRQVLAHEGVKNWQAAAVRFVSGQGDPRQPCALLAVAGEILRQHVVEGLVLLVANHDAGWRGAAEVGQMGGRMEAPALYTSRTCHQQALGEDGLFRPTVEQERNAAAELAVHGL